MYYWVATSFWQLPVKTGDYQSTLARMFSLIQATVTPLTWWFGAIGAFSFVSSLISLLVIEDYTKRVYVYAAILSNTLHRKVLN